MSDPCLYEHSHVLRNILGIKSEDDLAVYENTVVKLALLELFKDDYLDSNALHQLTEIMINYTSLI